MMNQPVNNNQGVEYMDEASFKAECEKEAARFVNPRYMSPAWAKNIRNEYTTAVYRACNGNLNRAEGIFNEESSDSDLATAATKFFQKHPHIDYVCPTKWRERVLSILKDNFKSLSVNPDEVLDTMPIKEDEVAPVDTGSEIVSRPLQDPGQPVIQIIKDISSRIWSSWRMMSDSLAGVLLQKLSSGEIEEKDFNAALRLRDNIKKLAADMDDLAISFRITKHVEKKDEK